MEEAREEQQQQELKHLGSVRAAAIQTIVFVSAIYDYAKHNSGSLMPTLERVEGAVAAVVSPVYDKFKDVPDDLLLFLDAKVDSAAAEFDEHAPPLAKQVAGQVQDMIKKASDVAVELLVRAQSDGTQAAALYAATQSKQLALTQTVRVYSKLDQLPAFHSAAQVTVPLAAFWSTKYNTVISDARERFPLLSYAPLIPVDDIATAFNQTQAAKHSEN